jgi:hypothetical protein
MTKDAQPKPMKTTSWMKRAARYAGVLLAGFLLGIIPIGLKTLEYSNSLAATKHQFALIAIPNSLASAVIDARRSDYEPARQAVSDFFTALRSQTDNTNDSAFSQAQREAVMPLLARRDELITLLARADPASADRLTDIYVSYRQIMNR